MSTLLETTSMHLPSNWQIMPLGEILSEVDKRYKDLNTSNELPLLSLTRTFGLILQSERFDKRVATEDVSKYKVVNHGEIVYNPYVIWEGAVHALKKFNQGLVSPVYVVWKCDNEQADEFIVDTLLRTLLVVEQYNRFSAGAVNRRRAIKKDDFLKIKIPLPPLPEQRRIARVLSTVQSAIEQQVRLIALTRELKSALMRKLFTEGLRGEKQKETEIGLVPEGWTTTKIGNVAKLQSGGTPSRDNPKYWTGGTIPWVKTTEINYRVIETTQEFITEEGLNNSAAKVLPKGTLLVAMYGQGVTRGRVGILGLDAAANQACAAITPLNKKQILTWFLYYYMQFHYQDLRELGHGANQRNLNMDLIKSFPLSYPETDEQQSIVDSLSAFDKKLSLIEQKRDLLEELFRTLLHQLMTGQVRVGALTLGPSPVATGEGCTESPSPALGRRLG